MRLTLLFLALAAPEFAQGVRFGVKAGVPLTPYFDTGQFYPSPLLTVEYSAATRRYVVGLSAEFRLHRSFALEVDGLFRRMGYVKIHSYVDSAHESREDGAVDFKGDSWDFPMMAKHRFGRGMRPYLAGGAVLRYAGPVRGRGELTKRNFITGATTYSPIDTTDPPELEKRVYPGLSVAGGIEFGSGRVRLLPEFRYTRWIVNLPGELRFHPNQAEFLVGFLF